APGARHDLAADLKRDVLVTVRREFGQIDLDQRVESVTARCGGRVRAVAHGGEANGVTVIREEDDIPRELPELSDVTCRVAVPVSVIRGYGAERTVLREVALSIDGPELACRVACDEHLLVRIEDSLGSKGERIETHPGLILE